jgi:7-keto-8-aminopelargonate synthetase-like enzyme
MMVVNEFPDRTIIVDQKEYLYFGGTAYLGLPTNKDFQKVLMDNIIKWGTAYGSSKNANIQLSAYEEAEKYLAKKIKAEAAVTISSGTLAGKLVIEQLTLEGNNFFYLPNVHNAIKAANMHPIWINDVLNPKLLDTTSEKITILTDVIPVTYVKPINLSFISQISATKEITLVLDESHSLGIIGNNGCGYYSSVAYKNVKRKIMISSLGKAMGVTGGVICGSETFVNQIKVIGNYASGAGMNPGFAITIGHAKKIYETQLAKLKVNLNYIADNLNANQYIDFDVNYPIIYAKQENVYQKLIAANIIMTHFKYPNEAGALNRIIITANHQKKDLQKLISILNGL